MYHLNACIVFTTNSDFLIPISINSVRSNYLRFTPSSCKDYSVCVCIKDSIPEVGSVLQIKTAKLTVDNETCTMYNVHTDHCGWEPTFKLLSEPEFNEFEQPTDHRSPNQILPESVVQI